MLHKSVTLADRHAPHSYEYVNEAARLAATGFVASDIGKQAVQLDNYSLWILSATTPTWVSVADNVTGSVTSVFGESGVVSSVNFVQLDTSATPGTPTVGQSFWDDANGTISTTLKGGNVTLQHGQELHIHASNNSGSTIPDGSVVYISGGGSGNTYVLKAIANSTVQSDAVIGICTEDILNGGQGFVTSFGYVNDLNTSSFLDNDVLWLSPSVAGGITNVKPSYPDNAVKVGWCTYAHATNGRILVSTQKYANASDIELPKVGTPVDVIDVLDWFRHSWSTGCIDGGDITYNGDGTINIAASDFILRQGPNEDDDLVVYRNNGTTNLALNPNDVTYVYLDYNSGNPTWSIGTSLASFNGIDKVITYTIGLNDTTANIVDLRRINVDAGRKSRRQKAEFTGYVYRGWFQSLLGESILTSSGLNILVGVGKYFYFDNPITHSAFDTTVAGTALPNRFTYFYNRTGTWTQITNSKTINNTQYDLAGTLTTMNNNRFRCDWVYVVMCGGNPYLAVILGNAEYTTLVDAKNAPLPALPPQFDGIGVLVGQVTLMKTDATLNVAVPRISFF